MRPYQGTTAGGVTGRWRIFTMDRHEAVINGARTTASLNAPLRNGPTFSGFQLAVGLID